MSYFRCSNNDISSCVRIEFESNTKLGFTVYNGIMPIRHAQRMETVDSVHGKKLTVFMERLNVV